MDAPELLSDFKAAALSVTNLYKSAAASQEKSRSAGYQDAIEDLCAFLDKENLGLMDGEGWRVRQWATERLTDEGGVQRQNAGSEDEVDDGSNNAREESQQRQDQASRSSSPETQRKPAAMPMSSSELQQDLSPRRDAVSEPPPPSTTQVQHPPTREDFTFRSTQNYPTNHDREGNMDVDTAAPDTTSVRLIPRSSRSRHHSRRTANPGSNTPTINFNLGAGAGNKRKMPYPDFFDISNFTFDGSGGKDGGNNGGGRGGGKRGRHI